MNAEFFRPATEKDFTEYEVEIDYFRYMSDDIKVLIEADNIHEAIRQLREQTGKGLADLKRYCEVYQKYIFAKRDFENGKQVFVSY